MNDKEELTRLIWVNYRKYYEYKVAPFNNITKLIEIRSAVKTYGAIPGAFTTQGRRFEPMDYIKAVIRTLVDVNGVYSGLYTKIDHNKMYGSCKGDALSFYVDSKLIKPLPWALDSKLAQHTAKFQNILELAGTPDMDQIYNTIKDVCYAIKDFHGNIFLYHIENPKWEPDMWFMLYLEYAIETLKSMLRKV